MPNVLDTVTINVSNDLGGDSYFDVGISGSVLLDPLVYDAWCVDKDTFIDFGQYSATLYSSYDDIPTSIVERPQNLDLVNWIINQNYTSQGFTTEQITNAIWALVEDPALGNYDFLGNPGTDFIYTQALANGEGFVPDCDDLVAIIVDPEGNRQNLIIEVPKVDLEGCPDVDVEKYVSFDGGETWFDVDDAPGLTVLDVADPLFKFVVTNTGTVNLTNLTLTDSDFDLNGDAAGTAITIDALAAGAKYEFVYEGAEWQSGQHTNTATVETSFTSRITRTTTNLTDSDDANYVGVTPSIDVEKYVSVDGGTTWLDADTQEDQPVSLFQDGIDPQFQFIVTNDGDVDLTNVTLSDDVFNLDGLDGDTMLGDGVYTLDFLAAGDSVIITYPGVASNGSPLATTFSVIKPPTELEVWQPGQHTNTATVTGSFTDDLGNTATPTDSDAANYDGQALPEVTDAAWCKIYVTKNSFKPTESPDLVVALDSFFEDLDDGFEGLDLSLEVTKGSEYFEVAPQLSENGELIFDFNWKNGNLFDGEAEVTVTATDPDGHSVDYILPIELWGNGSNKQKGDQVFNGMDCNEYFHGGRGKDTIYGNGGDDILNGGGGQDTLVGGAGSDIFVLAPLDSYDGSGKGKGATIMDFEDGIDLIGLTDGLTYDGISVQQDGNNVGIYEIFSKGANNLIGTILNANVSQFDASDFQAVAY